jgi:hypothetical protein
VGDHGIPHHLDDRDPALREAVGHLRPQAVLHRGDHDLHHRLGCARSPASIPYQLAAFRAIQGIGAGGLFSLALAIIGDIVPPRERAKYQGYFLAVFGTSSVLGPVIGGFFAGADSILGITGWRWVFLVNVPIAWRRCSSSPAPCTCTSPPVSTTASTGGAPSRSSSPSCRCSRRRAGPRVGLDVDDLR